MNSREALKHIIEDDFNMIITTYPPKPAYNGSTKEDMIAIIERDLDVLEFFKKLFVDVMPIRLTDLQDEKYLAIPNSDIRRPDALLPISNKEYELLKEWFRSNLLKEWLGNDTI